MPLACIRGAAEVQRVALTHPLFQSTEHEPATAAHALQQAGVRADDVARMAILNPRRLLFDAL